MSVAFKATCQSGPSEGLFLTAHIHQWREEAAGSLIYDLSQGPRALWLCQGLSAGGGEAFMRVKRTMVSWRRTGSALSAAPMLMQWVVSKSTLLWKFTRSVKETLLERMFQAWTCITWSKGYGTKTAYGKELLFDEKWNLLSFESWTEKKIWYSMQLNATLAKGNIKRGQFNIFPQCLAAIMIGSWKPLSYYEMCFEHSVSSGSQKPFWLMPALPLLV